MITFKRPIFVFSLPRSGSTLLQRILVTHPKIASTSEPWLLLGPLSSKFKNSSVSIYNHYNYSTAVEEMIQRLPNKEIDHYKAINLYASSIYSKLCLEGEIYFLDKTPRYHMIAQEIIRTFPNAKFIFLIRDPLQVISSVIDTYGKGRINKVYTHFVDLYKGYNNLSSALETLNGQALMLQYDDLVSDPEVTINKVWDYLALPDIGNLEINTGKVCGSMGDQRGTKKYQSISSQSLNNWNKSINSIIRKMYVTNIIQKIPEQNLQSLEISKQDVLDRLRAHKVSYLKNIFIDLRDYLTSKFAMAFRPHLFIRTKLSNETKNIHLR